MILPLEYKGKYAKMVSCEWFLPLEYKGICTNVVILHYFAFAIQRKFTNGDFELVLPLEYKAKCMESILHDF